MMRARTIVGLLGVLLLSTACGESKFDVYMKGLEIEGESERGACKLEYADNSVGGNFMTAASISGDQIASCLARTKEALAYYEKAAAMGYEDAEFKKVLQRARDRVEHLEGMLAQVREMERDF